MAILSDDDEFELPRSAPPVWSDLSVDEAAAEMADLSDWVEWRLFAFGRGLRSVFVSCGFPSIDVELSSDQVAAIRALPAKDCGLRAAKLRLTVVGEKNAGGAARFRATAVDVLGAASAEPTWCSETVEPPPGGKAAFDIEGLWRESHGALPFFEYLGMASRAGVVPFRWSGNALVEGHFQNRVESFGDAKAAATAVSELTGRPTVASWVGPC